MYIMIYIYIIFLYGSIYTGIYTFPTYIMISICLIWPSRPLASIAMAPPSPRPVRPSTR